MSGFETDLKRDFIALSSICNKIPNTKCRDWEVNVEIQAGVVSYYDIYVRYDYVFPIYTGPLPKVTKQFNIQFNFPTGNTSWGNRGECFIEVDSLIENARVGEPQWASEFTYGEVSAKDIAKALYKTVQRINRITVELLPYHLKCAKCGLNGIKSHLTYHKGMYGIDIGTIQCSNSKRCKRRVRKKKKNKGK